MDVAPASYRDFSRRLHDRVLTERIMIDATLEVTRRCPLACAHCYNNLPMADREAREQELSTEELIRLLDQLADAGCLWLLFTGGEIFARRDFLDIYLHAKRKGFLVTLFTNGTLITARIADTLAEWRPFKIEITLYGRTRETYERLTQVPGSFDRCLAGIRHLKERGLPLAIKTVAVSVNRHEIWEMKRFVEEDLGLPFRFDAMMTPRLDCSQSPLAVRLTPAEIVELDLLDPGRVKEWTEFSTQFVRPQQRPGHQDEVYHCGGGLFSGAIDHQGRLSICTMSQRETLDLRRNSLKDGWTGFLAGQREKKISRVTQCTACQLKSACGMCPANAELESGDPEEPVEFLCHVAHLRALALGWPIPGHGACEFCPGGERHEEVVSAAQSLRDRAGQGNARRVPVFLPMVAEEVIGAGACCAGGCGL
jgi:radical SAM protein with 4Fe4S-binding SPASM domain